MSLANNDGPKITSRMVARIAMSTLGALVLHCENGTEDIAEAISYLERNKVRLLAELEILRKIATMRGGEEI